MYFACSAFLLLMLLLILAFGLVELVSQQCWLQSPTLFHHLAYAIQLEEGEINFNLQGGTMFHWFSWHRRLYSIGVGKKGVLAVASSFLTVWRFWCLEWCSPCASTSVNHNCVHWWNLYPPVCSWVHKHFRNALKYTWMKLIKNVLDKIDGLWTILLRSMNPIVCVATSHQCIQVHVTCIKLVIKPMAMTSPYALRFLMISWNGARAGTKHRKLKGPLASESVEEAVASDNISQIIQSYMASETQVEQQQTFPPHHMKQMHDQQTLLMIRRNQQGFISNPFHTKCLCCKHPFNDQKHLLRTLCCETWRSTLSFVFSPVLKGVNSWCNKLGSTSYTRFPQHPYNPASVLCRYTSSCSTFWMTKALCSNRSCSIAY